MDFIQISVENCWKFSEDGYVIKCNCLKLSKNSIYFI